MNILYPAMLAGLAAAAVPVALHLIARHRFPVRDFPSIALLQADIKTNVFAPRLIDVFQLLLRLAVLALIVAAMARLVGPAWFGSPAPRNVLVVLDNSASMQLDVSAGEGKTTSLWELAREQARQILFEVAAPGRCALLAAADRQLVLSELEPHPDEAQAALEKATIGDGTGPGLVAAVARAADMLRGRREIRSQIIVLTDLRASAFEARSGRDLARIAEAQRELGDHLQIVVVDVGGASADNLAIVDAAVRGGQVKIGDDAHVIARIRNTGSEAQEAKVRLSVADRDEPLIKEINVPAGADAVVDLTARANRATRAFAQTRLQLHDAMTLDDQFDVPLNVVDHRRVLIVRSLDEERQSADLSAVEQLSAGQTEKPAAEPEAVVDGATILRYALNPGRELGLAHGTGIDSTVVTPEALAGQPLSKYELVVLYDISGLNEAALADLEQFVRQGKGLLIVCSGKTSPVQFNRSLAAAAPKRSALAPAELGNDETLKSALGLSNEQHSHPLLAAFGDPLQGDLSVLRFNTVRQARNLQPDARVALALTEGQPLAIEKPLGLGTVMMLTCGVELDRCNLARARVFPKLLWRLVDYLSGGLDEVRPDVLVAGQPAVLDVSEPSFALATDLELAAASEPKTEAADSSAPVRTWQLPISAERSVLIEGLPAGRYLLRKPQQAADGLQAGSYARYVTVQPDPRESLFTRVSADDLTALWGPGVQVATQRVPADLTPSGSELWTLLVVLLLLAYAAEAAFGWLQTAARERRRLE